MHGCAVFGNTYERPFKSLSFPIIDGANPSPKKERGDRVAGAGRLRYETGRGGTGTPSKTSKNVAFCSVLKRRVRGVLGLLHACAVFGNVYERPFKTLSFSDIGGRSKTGKTRTRG